MTTPTTARALCAALFALTVVGCGAADTDTTTTTDVTTTADSEAVQVLERVVDIGERIKDETGDYPRFVDEYIDAGLEKPDEAVLTMTETNEDDDTDDVPPCVEVRVGEDAAAWQPTDGLGITAGDCNTR